MGTARRIESPPESVTTKMNAALVRPKASRISGASDENATRSNSSTMLSPNRMTSGRRPAGPRESTKSENRLARERLPGGAAGADSVAPAPSGGLPIQAPFLACPDLPGQL